MNISGKFLSKFIGIDMGSSLYSNVEIEGKKSEKQGCTKNVYAGNLNLNNQDLMAQKKSQAQKKALKTILDQHKQEKALDDTVGGLKKEQQDLQKEYGEYQDQIKDMKQKKQDLMESYGVAKDSKEQQDLELREKALYGSNEPLTADERKKLSELGPETEYQKRALDLDENMDFYNKLADQSMKAIAGDTSAMHSIDVNRAKSHAMEDAVDEADSIMAAASKEAIGDMLGEVKDNIDKKLEENKKKAQEAKEEKKAKEEKAEKAKKKEEAVQEANKTETDNSNTGTKIDHTETDKILDLATDSNLNNDPTLEDLKKAIEQTGILAEDATGIVVDKQI